MSSKDINKIQKIIFDVGLRLDLEKLSDRIGNIICKLPIENFVHELNAFSPERGIQGYFRQTIDLERKYCLHILSEEDHVLVNNQTEIFTLNNNQEIYEYQIAPNNYKNTIIITDKKSSIVYYLAVRNYTYESNYFWTVNLPNISMQCFPKRKFVVNGNEIEIDVYDMNGIGDTFINSDVFEIEKRRKLCRDNFTKNHNFFAAFQPGEQEKAYKMIIDIINATDLFWDLKEIWLVDPYLSPNDILKTIIYSQKYNINLKCLTDIGTINKNPYTREVSSENKFQETKREYKKQLQNSLFQNNDLNLEYRTVYNNHGIAFHDRYLILKYEINRCRVWSLGTSVNALGKSHHIIQTVNTPSEIFRIIQEIWNATEFNDCLIYKKIGDK